jgi:hypothetical protein
MTEARSRERSAPALEAAAGIAAVLPGIDMSPVLARMGASSPASMPTPLPVWAPAGYEATDIRILEWIGSHRRRPLAAVVHLAA